MARRSRVSASVRFSTARSKPPVVTTSFSPMATAFPWPGLSARPISDSAHRGRFLSGGYFMLPRERQRARSGPGRCRRRVDLDDLDWLLRHRPAPKSWRVSPARASVTGTRRLSRRPDSDRSDPGTGTTRRPSSEDLVRVNGFDERMGYGGEDRELGERLVHLRAPGPSDQASCDLPPPVARARLRQAGDADSESTNSAGDGETPRRLHASWHRQSAGVSGSLRR